jgi:uncharacterized protein
MPHTALITGASTGIGRSLAVQFANHGYDLVLVARNAAALDAVGRTLSDVRQDSDQARPTGSGSSRARSGDDRRRATAVTIIPADLAQPRSANALVEQLTARGIQIDVLVNNAGFGLRGEFAELPLDRQLDMIQLNVTTVTELTRLLLPGMLARRTGGVLNVASTAAFQPGPLMTVYYATKAFVLSFTEGIAEEVAGRDVKVSCLCPGPTETEFATRADVVHTNLFKEGAMGVDEVARAGFEGWNAGRVVVVPGFKNRQRMLAVRLAPRSFVRRAVKRVNSLAGS